MNRVSGKVALVTGAGSGIGQGVALGLAAEGAIVYASDIEAEGLTDTAKQIGDAGGRVVTLIQDVTDEARWESVIAAIKTEQGGLHILVNNAGVGIFGNTFKMTYELWRRQLTVNLDSVFLGIKHGIPLIAESGGGSVINMSAVGGVKGIARNAAYCAAKAGVVLLSKSVALECAQMKMNVRINTVHPGVIETPMYGRFLINGAPIAKSADPHKAAEMVTPLGYAGAPSDIANAVVFLASDESRYITGTEIMVDGGMTAGFK